MLGFMIKNNNFNYLENYFFLLFFFKIVKKINFLIIVFMLLFKANIILFNIINLSFEINL